MPAQTRSRAKGVPPLAGQDNADPEPRKTKSKTEKPKSKPDKPKAKPLPKAKKPGARKPRAGKPRAKSGETEAENDNDEPEAKPVKPKTKNAKPEVPTTKDAEPEKSKVEDGKSNKSTAEEDKPEIKPAEPRADPAPAVPETEPQAEALVRSSPSNDCTNEQEATPAKNKEASAPTSRKKRRLDEDDDAATDPASRQRQKNLTLASEKPELVAIPPECKDIISMINPSTYQLKYEGKHLGETFDALPWAIKGEAEAIIVRVASTPEFPWEFKSFRITIKPQAVKGDKADASKASATSATAVEKGRAPEGKESEEKGSFCDAAQPWSWNNSGAELSNFFALELSLKLHLL